MKPVAALQVLAQLLFLLAIIAAPFLYVYWTQIGHRRLSTKDWAQLTVVLLLAGLFGHLAFLAILATMVLLAIGIAWVWRALIMADVHYTRTIERTHLFPDEETTVTWTIRNEKPLPISWLHWQEGIQIRPFASGTLEREMGIAVRDVTVSTVNEGYGEGLDEITALGAFETLTKTSRVEALRRGAYPFGPVDLDGSDAMGLYTKGLHIDLPGEIVVYPRLYTLEEMDFPSVALLGDARMRSGFIEDPSWYRGTRQYQPTDPMKLVDWNVTARTCELQVKQFEPTTHPKLMIIANLHAFEHIWEGVVTEHMENVISTAGSLAQWGLDMGFEVGLHTNGALPGSIYPLRILPSAADDQLFVILDHLARIVLVIQRHVEDLLDSEAGALPQGCTLVLCTSIVTGPLSVVLADLGRRLRVVLVLVDYGGTSRQTPTIPNITVVHARHRTGVAA